MAAERRSFTDPLESFLYWDASFTIAFFGDTQSYHQECVAFESRLRVEAVISTVSDFVYDELAFVDLKAALIAEGRRTGQSWIEVKRNRPTFLDAIMPAVEAKKAELDRLTINLSCSSEIRDQAFQLMRDFRLLPADAYHIAIALDAGVNAFASLDEDFLRVDGIMVYTCLP
jgi:predicted nucleic acid-binding protein